LQKAAFLCGFLLLSVFPKLINYNLEIVSLSYSMLNLMPSDKERMT